jgi:hypothetical protein
VRNWLTRSALKLAILLAPAAGILHAGTNPATITVTASPSPWDMTVPLNVSVTITGGVGAPGGGFKLIFDNATIGTSVIPASGGTIGVTIPDSTYGIVTPSGLLPGSHTVGVIYSGDSNYQAQVSPATTVSIIPPPTTTQTTLTAPSTQLVVGQTVVLTAVVSSSQATGNVSFIDSNGPVQTTIATIALSGNLAATSPLSLSQGSHSIVAQYNGDTNFQASASNPVNITVGKANTTTTLTSPPANSAASAGTAITLSAQVAVQAPGVATLSGSIQFLDGANVLGTRTLSGGGAASMTVTLAAGSHTLTATYSGNSSLNSSSGSVPFAVNGIATITATPQVTGNAAVGQQLTITTVVSGPSGSGTPTGFVSFSDGTTPIGQIALDGKGNATLPNVSFGSAGTHFIFANYLGDTTFAPSSSSSFALALCPSSPVVGVTPSVTSPVYGQPVILTGTVSTNSATPPPGTIDFFADGQSLTGDMPLTLSNGSAQYGLASTSPLVAGAHTLIATYYCATGTTGISSSPVSLIINSDSSTTNLSVSGANGLTLTAVVLPVSPGYGIPTGSVQFMSGSTPIGQAVALDSSSGVATATLTATATGSVVAEYSGDGNFTSSNSAPVNVMAVSTSLTLTSSENPASFGDKITFTATVTNITGSNTPTGTIAFMDGTTSLGTAVTVSSTGQAQFSTAKLTSGSHTITASFNPTGLFQAVQASIGQYVAPAPNGGGGGGFGPGSTIAAAAAPASAVYGQTVTLTTTVTPTGTGNPPTPTGQVTYQNGTTVLGTAPVGQGLALSSLSPGTYNVTASYAGDTVYSAAQVPISFVMAQASTQTTFTPTLNQTGQATLTATVTVVAPGAGNPTGSVQFQDASENNLTITSAALAGGTATAIVDANIATHQIIAVYNGDPNFSGSSSASQLQLVSTAANITFSFAPDEAVSAYHVTNLTGDTTAPAFPLGTSLAGASIKITDSTGVSWLAPLYGVFASASQINFVMPSTVALGPALVTALLPGGTTMATVANITQTSPAIFTANMNGQGVAAGQFVHVAPGFLQTFDSIAVFDKTKNTYVPNPVSFGPAGDQLYLVLYGTGIRHRSSDAVVSATVNGVTVPIQTAAQGVYPGLDQMNLQLPNSLAGVGTVNVIVTVNGKTANTVQIALQ